MSAWRRGAGPKAARVKGALVSCLVLGLAGSSIAVAAKSRWAYAESENFVVLTDSSKQDAVRVVRRFEEIRSVYLRALPGISSASESKLLIVAPKDLVSLRKLYGRGTKASNLPDGQFFYGRFEPLAMVRLDSALGSYSSVVSHEYFHHISRDGLVHAPPWLVEGLAEFWSGISATPKQWKIGVAGDRLGTLQQVGELGLERLLTMGHAEQDQLRLHETLRFYAQSWAVVHYLLVGDQSERTRRQLERFRLLCRDGVSYAEAAAKAFPDLETLAQRVRQHIRRPALGVLVLAKQDTDGPAIEAGLMSEQRTAERLGRFLLGIGRSQRARELFERAAELDPSSSAARGGLARVAMREQRYEQAAELFREAAELEAPSSETLYGYAVVNLLRQDPPKLGQAEATLLRAVREDGPAPVLSRLAAVYAELDPSPERALALAKRAINAYPLSLHYRLRLAAILAGAGRRDDAVAEIERTRILAASRDGASNNLCWQGVLLGIAESVLPLCEQAVALEPDDYAERDTRGVARLATGDVEGGLEDLRFAVEHAPEGRERFLETRRAWIEALENGENPLTGERLRAFREDPLEGGLLWNY